MLRVYKEAEKHLRDDKNDGRKVPSTLYFISSFPFTEENCHQIVFSVRSRWMYEAQHNTIDAVLLKDMQHCCDENNLASIIGLTPWFITSSPLQEKRCPNEGMTILNTVLRKLQGKLLLSPTKSALRYLRTILC